MFTLNSSKNDTSLALDILRAVAAQMVCIGHGIAFFVPQLRGGNLPLMQNVGVLVFFVLSGLLITYTLVERSAQSSYGFMEFFVERSARIYSGLIPCLILIAIVDAITVNLAGGEWLAATRSMGSFLANVAMLESYRGALDSFQWMQWPIFGSAAPLWTLVIEWHIYLFAGAVFFIGARPASGLILIPVALVFSIMPVHYVFGALQPDGIGQGLFLLWLGGAWLFLLLRGLKAFPPAPVAWGIAALAATAFVASTSARGEYRPAAYPLLILMVFGIVSATQSSRRLVAHPRVRSGVRFVAGYSFTLYLIHHTLMFPVFLLWKDAGFGAFIAVLAACNLIAAALALQTEMKHKELARYLLGLIERCKNSLQSCRTESRAAGDTARRSPESPTYNRSPS